MSIASFVCMGAGIIALFGSLLLIILKNALENIDNLEEDDEGFYDRRDRK